MIFVDFVVR